MQIDPKWELVLYLPSWRLNYSKTLYNKLFEEALSLRMPLLFLNTAFVFKEQLLFFFIAIALFLHSYNCYVFSFKLLQFNYFLLQPLSVIQQRNSCLLLTFMTGPGNYFNIVWKYGRLLCDLTFQALPAKGKVFFGAEFH